MEDHIKSQHEASPHLANRMSLRVSLAPWPEHSDASPHKVILSKAKALFYEVRGPVQESLRFVLERSESVLANKSSAGRECIASGAGVSGWP